MPLTSRPSSTSALALEAGSQGLQPTVTLVSLSGHLVKKEELLREMWPGTLVQEVNLTVNI